MSEILNDREGFRINAEPRTFLSKIRQVVGEPDITKKEYRDRVEKMAESVLSEYDEDVPLEERIHEVVESSRMFTHYSYQKIPILYHQNEPEHLRVMMNGTKNPTDSLAYACLLADVRVEVENMIRNLEGLVRDIIEEYEDISQIHLVHTHDVAKLIIHTSEDNLQEYYTPYIRINTKSEEILRRFDLTPTLDGPGHIECDSGTTIYTSESAVGEDSCSLEGGLEILRKKVEGDSDE